MSVDRKRACDDAVYPSKKPLQELSTKGPLTQADVVYFKKEAIWRQMKHYKSRAQELNTKVADYERRLQSFVNTYALLESWYAYVVELAQKEKPRKLDLDASAATVEEIVEERRRVLQQLMEQFVASKPHDSETMATKCLDLEADLQQTKVRCDELQDTVEALEARVHKMKNDVERSDSSSLKRVLLNSHVEAEAEAQPEVKAETPTTAVKPEEPDTSAQEQELQSLRIEFDTLNAAYTALSTALSDKEQELQSVRDQNQLLENKLADLKEPDLMKSKFYLSVLEKHKALLDKFAHNSKISEQLVKRLEEAEAREGNWVGLIGKEITEENSRLKELLSKAENDLVRVRTARDELIGKHTILKSELDSSKDNSELLKMNTVLHERLKRYENENDASSTLEDEALAKLEKPELIKRLASLNSELKDIERAFQETRELSIGKEREHVDKESIIKKLTIEKTKADQKYFASMRLKDSLSSENKVLKSQVAKSQELVAKSNDLEKAYVSKIELLTKTIDDYKAIKQSSVLEATSLHQTINQLTKSRDVVSSELKALKSTTGELRSEFNDKSEKLSELKVAHAKTEARLRSTESLLNKYKQNNTSSILQEDEKQMEALRTITKCSVCSKNWKNMAITACGHVFCDGCVQERLNARLRRCPTCNKGFSSNDLLQIHL